MFVFCSLLFNGALSAKEYFRASEGMESKHTNNIPAQGHVKAVLQTLACSSRLTLPERGKEGLLDNDVLFSE